MRTDQRSGSRVFREEDRAEPLGMPTTMDQDSEAHHEGSILVVDDTPANLRLLSKVLKDAGYEVRPFPAGALALRAAENNPPDLILLDIMMPQMDGFEVCRRLKANEDLAGIPVIFLSALTETEDKVHALEIGGVDYITKPFRAEEVLARVRTQLTLRRLHLALEEKYDQLRELESLRDSLTHMIVHDLRSPLSGILASLEILEMTAGPRLEPQELEDVDLALQSTRTMVEMVSSLLDVNRLEAGEMPLTLKEVSLGEVAQAALVTLGGLLKDRDVEYDEGSDAVTATVDEDLMTRVMVNLMGNALKFTPESGSVRLRVLARDGGFRVEVRDTGPGIPEEFRTKIFEKFGQVEGRGRGQKYSTGLGLAFCKLAVEAHGGEIGVDSEMGVGSTFWFQVPKPNPPGSERGADLTSGPAATHPPSPSPATSPGAHGCPAPRP